MADQWMWWAGSNNERFTIGPCETRQEAIDKACEGDLYVETEDAEGKPAAMIILVEAIQYGIDDLEVDPYQLLETFEESHEEWVDPEGGGDLFSADRAQMLELGDQLTEAFREWARANGTFIPWGFKDSRNEERVYFYPDPESSDA